MKKKLSKALLAELKKGYKTYQRYQTRESMYETASFLVEHFWRQPAQLANGLGTLLLTWNKAFYRVGAFDFQKLERCLRKNAPHLNQYRNRHIRGATEKDYAVISALFLELLEALAIAQGPREGTQTPVGGCQSPTSART